MSTWPDLSVWTLSLVRATPSKVETGWLTHDLFALSALHENSSKAVCTQKGSTDKEIIPSPSASSVKVKRVVRLKTSVCFRIIRLMNNQTKNWRKATSHTKEERAMTRVLWLLWKVYHKWVVYHKIQMHSLLKVECLGEIRCRKSWNQFKGHDSPSLRYVMRVFGKRTIVGKNQCQSSSSAKSLRCEIWGQVPWRDWTTAAMCPKQGLESC